MATGTQNQQKTLEDLDFLGRFLFTLSTGAILRILTLIAFLSSVISLLMRFSYDAASSGEWLEGWLQNFSTELFGALLTFIVIEKIVGGRARQREEEREAQQEKERLIRQMRNPDNGIALQAIAELRVRGWHSDGSLGSAQLSGANLEGAELYQFDFFSANLMGVNLRNAKLSNANLQHALLNGANLTGANLQNTNLAQSHPQPQIYRQLAQAYILQGATLPDGERYHGYLNLVGDIELAKLVGIDTKNPEEMAKFYGVSLHEYQAGQAWRTPENLAKLENGDEN